jgi:hypothetical protein
MMNSDGSGQTRLTTYSGYDLFPDWGTALNSEEDTLPPLITVPEDMTVEATGPEGAQISFEEESSAVDDVDGPVDVTCDYNSGDTFPIGEKLL